MDGMNNFSASEFQEMPKNEIALGQEEYCPAMTFSAKNISYQNISIKKFPAKYFWQ